MNDARYHCPVAKCGILGSTEHCCVVGIHHCHGRLTHLCRLRLAAVVPLTHIVALGTAGAVAGEIVAWNKNVRKGRVARVDAGVNHRDDARAGHVKHVLGVFYSNDLSGGLIGVPVPHRRTKISDRSRVI